MLISCDHVVPASLLVIDPLVVGGGGGSIIVHVICKLLSISKTKEKCGE